MKNGLPPPNYGAIEKNSSEEENEEIKAKEEEAKNYSTEYEPLIWPESGNYLEVVYMYNVINQNIYFYS